jgi:hypothetical protein
MWFQINWSDIRWFEFSEINNIPCINKSQITVMLAHKFIVTTPEHKISESETGMDAVLKVKSCSTLAYSSKLK